MDEMIYVTTKSVFLEELKEDMMIDQDVYSLQGSVLIPNGHILKNVERVKDLLISHNVVMIRVRLPETAPVPDPALDPEAAEPVTGHQKQFLAFQESYAAKCTSLKSEFQRILLHGDIKRESLDQQINETLIAFEADINVMQLMQKVRDLDDTTYAHSQNVALTTHLLGRWMELPEQDLKDLTLTALLIDIGKMKVSTKIMQKKGSLSEEEFAMARKHAQYSYEAVKDFTFLSHQVILGVLHHHERMDGSGYPLGLKGEDIPFYARVVAIADVYNALTSNRPHRSKKTPFDAIRLMETEFNTKLDPTVLYLFLNRIGTLFTGQQVVMDDGTKGEIVFVPRQNMHRPMVKLNNNREVLDLSQPVNHHLFIRDFV